MATLSLSGGDPKPKKKTVVDACSNGNCGPKKKNKLSIGSAFNPNKPKYGFSKPHEDHSEKTIPPGGTHMNMNNLAGEPGDTKLAVDNNKTALSSNQEKTGTKLNFKTRKQKKRMGLYLD